MADQYLTHRLNTDLPPVKSEKWTRGLRRGRAASGSARDSEAAGARVANGTADSYGANVTSVPPTPSDPSGKRLFWTLTIGGLVSLAVGSTLFVVNQGTGTSGAAGPGVSSATYATGDSVDIWRNDSWLPGKVIRAEGARYLVAYDLADVFAEEWLDASRLRAAR